MAYDLPQLNAHIGDETVHLTPDQNAGLDAATTISGSNPVATIQDVLDAGHVVFQGTWDATSGSAPSATPEQGQYWIVNVDGSTSVDGITDWKIGDWIIYNDATLSWEKIDNTQASVVANQVGYNNATSGLTAIEVQAAIDELDSRTDALETDSHTHANKALLDSLTDAGGGTTFLANDGTYKAVPVGSHATTHVSGGTDEIDGDKMDVDFVPANYTRTTAPTEVSALVELTAHLAGIDNALSGASTDEKVGVSADDTTAGYLEDKVVGTAGKITLTTLNPAGNEQLQIGAGADLFDTVTDDTDIITEGSTNLFYTEARVSANADVLANTTDRHTHANKAALDLVSGTNTGDEVQATETVLGIAEIATQAETDAGTDDLRIVTPLKLASSPIGTNSHASGSDNQNLYSNVTGDTGSATAGSQTDSIKFEGGLGIDTVASEAPDKVSIAVDQNDLDVENFATANNDTTLALSPDGTGGLQWLARGTGLNVKAGNVLSGSFSGNPKSYTVVFSTAYPNSNYSINLQDISASSSYKMTVSSKTASGFTMTTNTGSVSNLDSVDWHTIAFGEE